MRCSRGAHALFTWRSRSVQALLTRCSNSFLHVLPPSQILVNSRQNVTMSPPNLFFHVWCCLHFFSLGISNLSGLDSFRTECEFLRDCYVQSSWIYSINDSTLLYSGSRRTPQVMLVLIFWFLSTCTLQLSILSLHSLWIFFRQIFLFRTCSSLLVDIFPDWLIDETGLFFIYFCSLNTSYPFNRLRHLHVQPETSE